MDEQNYSPQPYSAGDTGGEGPQSNGQTYTQQAPYAADQGMTQTGTQQTSYAQSQTAGQGYGQQGPVYVEPAQAYTGEVQPQKDDTPVQSIVGLVLGILSIMIGCCYGVGALFGIPGIILSVIGNKKKKTGVGTAGLITSIIGLVLSIIMIICVALGVAAILSDPTAWSNMY